MLELRTRLLVSIGLVAPLLAAPADAQRLGRTYVDEQNGFQFQPPDKWTIVPVQPGHAERGILARIESDEPDLDLYALRSSAGEDGVRKHFLDRLDDLYGAGTAAKLVLLEEEEIKVAALAVRHRQARVDGLGGHDILFDVWTYPLSEHDVELVFSIRAEDRKLKGWLQTFKRSARTFAAVARKGLVEPDGHASYAAILAFHEQEAARTPGWRALPTPSQKYVVKTSSDNNKFVAEVIERLELSRELYERDFPPQVAMEHVSVVRVCGTDEEFHRYGNTNPGVAGWYNPDSKELVLYDAKNINRNSTYAVMSHEAFHQYCHFLFDRSEAHRWFDEGHGDYYGGARFERGRASITPHMPGGLDRLSIIREMLTAGTWAPLVEHLNYSHKEWQSQGPSNVSCYAQSWSIVYFLREGTLGNVSRKVWRDEYANIIPSYTRTLFEGFQAAYREARAEQLAAAAAESDGGSVVIGDERKEIGEERKQAIWKEATQAAWGEIDLERFEQDWLLYVKKYLD